MRTVALIATFVVLAGVFCGGKTGSLAAKPAAVKWPTEATATLTEDEMVQFVKVLPAFSLALKAGNWTPAPPKEGDGPVASLTNFVESMNVPGLDDSLKKAGSSWSVLRPTLYKVFAASAAKKGVKDYEAFKAACAGISDANKQTVAKHQQDLQALQTLGR